MTWKVRFRDTDFNLDEGFDPEFEYEIRESLTDKRALSGSVSIIFHEEDERIVNITFDESTDPHRLPFTGIHGQHPELGEVYIFYGIPDDGDGQVIALYSAEDFGNPPVNNERYPLGGSSRDDSQTALF